MLQYLDHPEYSNLYRSQSKFLNGSEFIEISVSLGESR